MQKFHLPIVIERGLKGSIVVPGRMLAELSAGQHEHLERVWREGVLIPVSNGGLLPYYC